MNTKKILLAGLLLFSANLLISCGGDGIGGTGQANPGVTTSDEMTSRLSIPFREHGYSNLDTQVIHSQTELDRLINTVNSQNNWNDKAGFLQAIESAKLDLSKDNLLLYRITEPSGSITLQPAKPVISNNEISVIIDRQVPTVGTTDMAYYLLAYAVKKNITKASFDNGIQKIVIDLKSTPDVQGKLVRSDEAGLLNYFKDAAKRQTDRETRQDDVNYSVAMPSSNESSGNFSGTNIQEAGVDEADLIKTDGRYIFSVKKPRVLYEIDTPVAADVATNGIIKNQNNSDIIRIMDTQNSSGITEIKRFSNADTPWNIAGLYLRNNDSTADKRLIAISSKKISYMNDWFDSRAFENKTTDVLFFDINNPSNASISKKLSFEGQLLDSRSKGDMLYLVLRHFSSYQYVDDKKLANTTNETFLPSYTIDNKSKQLVVKPENCYIDKGQKGSANVITVVAIDLKSANPQINSQCYVGSAEAIYASQDALYLATTAWNYQVERGVASYDAGVTTDIHKFAYNGLTIDYRGSGTVDGHLGYKQDSKSFRFSERNGLLRVVTFDEQMWIGILGLPEDTAKDDSRTKKSPVLLSILKEDPNTKSLTLVSKLPNTAHPKPIGLPGERLYATRFIGDRAYVVTYKVTDPLYIIDLSDSTNPKILGELKVDGYSDYLHPISDTLLLGIGKDAIAGSGGIIGDGRGAWYQGVKLSLIDVTDPSSPQEVDKIILGKRGTQTTALYDHHAVTGLKVGSTYRVAIPVALHAGTPDGQGIPPAATYYNYTHTGLYRFEVDINNQTIQAIPAMVINNAVNDENKSGSLDDRSVIIGDNIFYMHQGDFWTQDWAGNNAQKGPK